jgi:hypothetical protein
MGPLCLLVLAGCYKPLDLEKNPIPPNSLMLEFSAPVRYVMELRIDGELVPIRYARGNRRLLVEGLQPGRHTFNIDSISYVFGPEFERFELNAGQQGAYFFIQSRKYRSALPKSRAQVSIRAYRRQLRKEGIDVKNVEAGKVSASFVR